MRKAAEIAVRSAKGYGQNRCGLLAAGITYFALFSLFPMTLLALSVTGYVITDAADQQRLIDRILNQVPLEEGSGRRDLEQILSSIVDARGTLGLIGFLGAAYSGSALFTGIRNALNNVFQVENARNFLKGKLIDLGLVLLFGTLLTVSVAASIAARLAQQFSEDIAGEEAAALFELGMEIGYFLAPPIFTAIVFLMLYTLIPAKRPGWRSALPGVIVATLVFELLKFGFAWYISTFGNYDATYGTLGFVIILLMFIYLSSQVMLFGAEIAWATADVRPRWPLPEDEMELNGVRRKGEWVLEKLRLRKPREAAGPSVGFEATGSLPPPQGEPAFGTLAPEHEDQWRSSATRRRPSSWPGLAMLAGIAFSAWAVVRRARRAVKQ
ncbi:MAG: YihY/virulence factor BrkB family protein [Dehalococcoidia bacterium]|nr:YihY/virulence factor BrkB family protein [Dehalococcoidia bacterium]